MIARFASVSGDQDPLVSLEKKRQLIRDLVTGVVKGYKHGLYLHGGGGMGKSHTVLTHLKLLDAPYQLHNTRMTAKGLFQSLGAAQDITHVLEDMERLTKDADAQGVLRMRDVGTTGAQTAGYVDYSHKRPPGIRVSRRPDPD